MPFLFEGHVKSLYFPLLRSMNENRFMRGVRILSSLSTITLLTLNTSCTLKANNEAHLAALKAGGPEISQFDVPSTHLQAGATLNIPFAVTSAAYTDLATLTLQYASDGVNFIDVAPVDPASSVIVWNVPKTEVAHAKLQLIAVSTMGKSSSKQSSSFNTSLNPLNASLFSVSSANPTGSTSATFSISDCTNRVSVYASESKVTPLGTEKSWITCSTTSGAIPFTLSSKEGIHTVYFWTKDKDENISDPVSVNVTLDKTGPALAFTNAPLASSSVTGGSIYVLGFTASDSVSGVANIKVQYSSDNGATFSDLSTLASTASSYNWIVPTAAVSSVKLKIVAQDAAGNLSSLVSPAFSIVLTPPTVSIGSPLASSYANSSNYTSFPVSGSCSAQGGSVAVTASDGASHTATASTTCNLLSSPNWTVNLNLAALNNTSVNLSAVHTNAVGTSTTSSTVTVIKDSTNPTLSITTPTILNPINASNVSSFSVTGSCSENSRGVTVSATDGTTTVSSTPTCNTAGSPQFSTSLNLTGLLDGNITVSATQTDVAGNTGAATQVTVTKDVAVPTVVSVSTSSSSGIYVVGSTVSIQVAFSKAVNVTSTPQITVATGAVSTSRTANYTSGTGTNTLTFTYTVQNGDYSTQLNYPSTTALALNGGTIQDAATNNATLTLPATGSSYSLAGTSTTAGKTIKINSATLAQSTVATSLGAGTCTTASSCKKTQTTSIVLTTKDSSSNPMSLGGLTVTFSASTGAGVSTGTLGSVTDNGDGTYTATFTATGSGTATTITATISGLGAVTSTTTILVTNAAPVITPLATKTYPLDGGTPPVIQGNSVTLATATDADNDTITLSCTYKTLGLNTSDPNYAASGTNCSNLDTITTSGSPATGVIGKLTPTTTGTLSWTPTYTQRGTYQFTINGTDGVANAASQAVTVSVRAGYTTTNLLSALDALNATNASGLSASTPSAPFTTSDTAGSCLNLLSSASNGSLTFGTSNPWGGTGQTSTSLVDPYRLSFSYGNSDSLSLGTVMNTATQFSTEVWVKPSPLPSASPAPIIVGNGGGTGDGFVLRQSQVTPNRAEFVVGKKYYSYRDLILSDMPITYWRLNESSGTTAKDTSAYQLNGTYVGNYTLGLAGATSDSDNAVSINDANGTSYIGAGTSTTLNVGTSNFSIEAWVNMSSPPGAGTYSYVMTKETYSPRTGYEMYISPTTGYPYMAVWVAGTGYYAGRTVNVADGNWHHIVGTRSGTTLTMYVDGVASSSVQVGSDGDTTNAGSLLLGWYYAGKFDELAIYKYALSSTQVTEHYQTGLNGNYKAYPGNAILADKPLRYWRLGEKAGAIAYDLSGNAGDLTYTGGVTLGQTSPLTGSGDQDTSASFDGTSGYATGSDASLPLGNNPRSVSLWVNPTSYPNAGAGYYLFRWGAGVTDKLYSLLMTNTGGTQYLNNAGFGDDCLIANSLPLNTWSHLATVYDGTNASIYLNGSLLGSCSKPSWNTVSNAFTISNNSWYFPGKVDEVAVYNYPLSVTQIANHYNSGNGPGWWTCQSQTQINNSNWNLLSSLYDGTTAKLFVNGQQECSVTPGTTYSGTVANTVLGSNPGRTSNFWTGLLSTLKIFGTSNATAPASATTIKTNFDSEANRYRSTPVENIVTSGLVLNLDAANAKQGIAPYSNGCASSDLSWFDLSSSGFNGTLMGFSSCGALSGWVGSGTTSSPYALTFNGSSNYAIFPWNQLSGNAARTISGWFKSTSTANQCLAAWGASTTSQFSCLGIINTSIGFFGWGTSLSVPVSTSNYANGNWHHLAVTYDGSNRVIFIDGGQMNSDTATLSTASSSLVIGDSITIGNARLNGSIATIQIYNTALTAQQIKQNCIAQEKRFTNTQFSICAQP